MKKIEIDINSKRDFISDYNENTLEPNLRDFILNELVGYSVKEKLHIDIKSKEKLSEEEQEKFIKVLRKEFKECLADLELEVKYSNYKRISLLLIGVLGIFINYQFNQYLGEVLAEIFTIIGWVAIWELVYSILFTALSRRRNIKRYKQIIKANINFK